MIGKFFKDKGGAGSFLPEDYVQQKAERRTLLLTATLFVCVMGGVVAAFFVTNREWHDVRAYQKAVNERYVQAAQDIEQLKVLEVRKEDLLEKAEVTQALIERVPKSILMAELINRMPRQMTLMELDISSERKERRVSRSSKKDAEEGEKKRSNTRRGRSIAGRGKEAADEEPAVTAPEYLTSLSIVGVAPRHEDVAEYVRALQECSLLIDVELIRTQRTRVEDTELHEFMIRTSILMGADAREITPLRTPRLGADPSRLEGSFDPDASLEFLGEAGGDGP